VRYKEWAKVWDGPAALEPNGKVLMMASPGVFNTPSTFLEWDGQKLTTIVGPPNAAIDSSFYGNMLVLPTGQILLTDFSNDIEIFTPTPPEELEYRPSIVAAPRLVQTGRSYKIAGYGFNGVSQGASYGDDAQGSSNYPLVRMTFLASGHVFYARTHDHTGMGVKWDAYISTQFDVPVGIERGLARLEVVANGVPSLPVVVVVKQIESSEWVYRRFTAARPSLPQSVPAGR
jgi:hypothetical protein